MKPNAAPRFPITVRFGDGEEWVFRNEAELASSLEWFDSDDPTQDAAALDAAGNEIRVVVREHQLLKLELVRSH
jgi:hypothetical protein